jgi:cobalt-zinc-cadmium efflux system outer membrane protein
VTDGPHRVPAGAAARRLAAAATILASAVLPCRVASSQAAASAPDTVSVTLDQLEARFLQENLQLLAGRFGVSAAGAAIEQARLWSNPNISIEQGAYNRATGAFFDYTRTGNTEIQLQQLFLLAGKRNKQVQLATINRAAAEYTLADLLRSLRHELRADFYDLHLARQRVAFDDRAIADVERTVASAERMYASRSILLSEVVRLRSLLLSVQTERLGNLSQIADLQGSLRVLMRDEGLPQHYYVPLFDAAAADSLRMDTVDLAALVSRARESRPDVRIASGAVQFEETNLSLQRALRVPDVQFGGRYSRAGSYIPDYFALSVSVDLPFLNRNQGNIKVSEYTLAANRRLADAARGRAEREVLVAFRKAVDADAAFHAIDRRFADEYDRLVAGTTVNYEQRNIGIIQFTDFFDAYRQTMQQLNQLAGLRLDAIEALNFAVGAVVVRP